MPKIPSKQQVAPPKLVNRGPAGLLTKKKTTPIEEGPRSKVTGAVSGQELWDAAPKDRIAEEIHFLLVDIDAIQPDPKNARLHPERNMASIKDSLCLYGQVAPVLVRQETMTIVAGSGRHQAMKELGWTKIAATVRPMTEIEAAGYGLADNRTAELAKWDFEVVAQIDQLLLEAGMPSVGWSDDELEVLRMADWTPPPIQEGENGDGEVGGQPEDVLLTSFTPDQMEAVAQALSRVRQQFDRDLDRAEGIEAICKEWLEWKIASDNGQTEEG